MSARWRVWGVAVSACALAGCANAGVDSTLSVVAPSDGSPSSSAGPGSQPCWGIVRPEERAWIREKLERHSPSWASYEPEPHLLVLHDREMSTERVWEIGAAISVILRERFALLFPPAAPLDGVFVLRVCKDEAQYRQYGGSGGSLGHWNPVDGEAVVLDDGTRRWGTLRTIRTIAFYQYLDYAGAAGTHRWFTTGVAAALSGPPGAAASRPHPLWAELARDASREEPGPSLREVVESSDMEFLRDPAGRNAALAWSLAAFLLDPPDARWGGVLDRYFTAYRDHLARRRPEERFQPPWRWIPNEEDVQAARAAALEAAFGGFDAAEWKRLDDAWRRSL